MSPVTRAFRQLTSVTLSMTILTALAVAQPAAAGVCLPGPVLPLGSGPWQTATGDLNDDGRLDVVVSCFSGGSDVLLGAGDGTFQASTTLDEFAGSGDLALGDVNDDGVLDVVMTAGFDSGVAVYLGLGDGSFATQTTYATNGLVRGVAVADLDGDGYTELIASDFAGPPAGYSIKVWPGNPDGSLAAPVSTPCVNLPRAIAVAHFNNDAYPDIAVASPNASRVSILLSDGSRGFLPEQAYFLGPNTGSIVAGDFDGDGKTDLAGVGDFDTIVTIRLGNGDGTFGPRQSYATGGLAYDLTVGDFDGDGNLDLAVPNTELPGTAIAVTNPGNTVSVLNGNGDGTFADFVEYPVGRAPYGLVAGDFDNQDGPDLLAANYSSENVLTLLNRGDGTFLSRTTVPVGRSPYEVAVGDFNSDEIIDVVVANRGDEDPSSNVGGITVLVGLGNSSFASPITLKPNLETISVAVGDLNNDLHIDIVAAHPDYTDPRTGSVSVFLGDGAGGFAAAPDALSNSHPLQVRIADFDLDGNRDIAVSDFGAGFGLFILRGRGDGTFDPPDLEPIAVGAWPFAVANFDAGPAPDLAIIGNFGLSVVMNAGDGSFDPPISISSTSGATMPAIGDLNGDGYSDIVTPVRQDTRIYFVLGNGDGTFEPRRRRMTGLVAETAALADINSDGITDVLLGPEDGSSVGVLLQLGDLTFGQLGMHAADAGARAPVVAPLAVGIGPDVIVANNDAGSITILPNRCSLDATTPGDLDCDGTVDAFDISPFILALTDPAGYAALFPGCDLTAGDVDQNGNVNAFDIGPFIDLLVSDVAGK